MMTLGIGLLLWSMVHLLPSLAPALRGAMIARMGEGAYKGIFSLLLVVAIVLMVVGWRAADYAIVYDPPAWGRHLNMTAMLFAVFLLGAGQSKSRAARWIRHPMLTGVLIWALGHLAANGDSRSLLLFGGMALWSIIAMIAISRRQGAWVKPTVAPLGRELLGIGIALAIYALLFWAHPYFAGIALIGG